MREFRTAWEHCVFPRVRFYKGDLPPSAKLYRASLMDAFLPAAGNTDEDSTHLFYRQLLDTFAYGNWRIGGEWQMFFPEQFNEAQ